MSAATMDSFIEVLKKSGLIPEARLQARLAQLEADPNQPTDMRSLAKALIESDDITSWQAEKLLTGKHKGFFLGKYKLLRLLGRGGMSAVYLAEHVLMKRRCAIKVLPTNRVNDSSYLGRFHLEAQAAAALDDPNIMRAYDVDHFVDGKTEVHFLVMEYVEGRNLHDVVVQDGPLPPLDAAEYIRQSASGLAHAHQEGLVHRDIKPGNLLLDLKGTVKILDMGLARFFEDGDENSLTIQHDERVLGTADFLSPEQAINSHKVDARADIYSLGCTLYFLLTKHAPFEQGSLAQRLMAHQSQEPPAVTTYRNDVPDSLLAILRKMMAKKPDDRHQTARAVADDLKSWIAEHADGQWMALHEKQWEQKHSAQGNKEQAVPATVAAPKTPPSTDEFGDFLTMIGKEPAFSSDPAGFSVADSAAQTDSAARSGSGAQKPKSSPHPAPDSQSVFTEQPPKPRKPGSQTVGNGSAAQKKTDSQKSSPPVETTIPGLIAPGSTPSAANPKAPEPSGESGFSAALFSETPADKPNSSDLGIDFSSASQESGVSGLNRSAPRSTKSKKPSPLVEQVRAQAAILWQAARDKPLIALGCLLALLSLFGYLFLAGDAPEPDPDSTTVEQSEETDSDEGMSQTPAEPKVVGAEITIGPRGTFTTLNEAIDYLVKYNDPFSVNSEKTIKIEAGVVIKEPLKILDPPSSFPRKLTITSATDAYVVWQGNGTEPLIQLENVEGLVFDHLQLNAAGAETAVQIEGRCPGTVFRRCFMADFAAFGMKLIGTAGLYNTVCRIEDTTFQTDRGSARGIQLSAGDATVESVNIERCRFLGPMETGIEFTTDVMRWINVKECLFHQLNTGIAFEVPAPLLDSVVIGNNTFHECGVGVRFQNMPVESTQKIGLVRNLFVSSSQQDVLMSQGYTAEQWANVLMPGAAGSSWNWTTRPAPTGGTAVNIFNNNGRVAVTDVTFQSTDPTTANFLKPADGKGKIAAATGFKPFVGAIAP